MGERRTRNQERILKVMKGLMQPTSAQDLYIQLRNHEYTIGLATVYRSLDALKVDGLVQVRTLPSGESLYSLPQEDRHHLTCLRCGNSILITECPVHDLEDELQSHHKFRIYYHTLEFFGLCPSCQAKEDAAADAPSL
ncbi:Fur family transcriptional regulator [Oscillatoria sp. CS-180]|uniref:Fur family transcriptional regulator n=1 Tax=Oscillatoria sp. CS-180 TaxID=3021720 RepID=UPI00232FD749|nr:Fur family transcriptional regulator [Oscillatoria sp. CS-180]MDB9527642.1 Fur family transcriptional regulator [Oscillatoria sp. CS-180]